MSTYGASKGAIISLTSGWALDLAESGIQVVAVSPVADTRLTPRSDATVAPSSDPAEIAPLIIYLLSGGAVGLSGAVVRLARSEEHTSELQSLMRTSYAVFCLKKKKTKEETEKIKTLITHNTNHTY